MTNKEMRKKLEEQFQYLATKSKSCEEKHLKSITNAMLDIYVVLNDRELLGNESLDFESKNTAPEVLAQEQPIKEMLSKISILLITASSITRKALEIESNFND